MSEAGLPQAWTLTLLAGAAARCGAYLSGRSALNARVNAFALELLRRVTAQANVEAGAGVGGGVKRLQRAHVEAALRGLGLARYVRGSPEQLQASQRPGAAAASGSKGAAKGKSRAASRSAASGAATTAGGKRRAAAGGKCPAAARGSAAESQGGSGAKRRRPAAAKAAAPEPAPPASSKRRKMARAPKLSAAEQAALAREQDLLLARSAARANVV